jgi:hypothetical protein
MYDGGRSKNSVELAQSIRRGEMGMTGLANWFERCFFGLDISLGMLEPRIERLIQAMHLLYVVYIFDFCLLQYAVAVHIPNLLFRFQLPHQIRRSSQLLITISPQCHRQCSLAVQGKSSH